MDERQNREPLFGVAATDDIGHRVRTVDIVDAFDARDETVSAAMQGFDEARPLGVIAKHRAQPLHGGVEAVLEVDEGAVRP